MEELKKFIPVDVCWKGLLGKYSGSAADQCCFKENRIEVKEGLG